MRALRLPLLLLLVTVTAAPRDASAGPTTLELKGPGPATQLLTEDVNGDGILDLVLGHGRTVAVWSGSKGKLPAATPTWTYAVPAGQSLVDADPRAPKGTPTLATYGTAGLVRVALAGGKATPADAKHGKLEWIDEEQVCFVDFLRQPGALLPRADGVELMQADGSIPMALPVDAYVSGAGAFVEDTTDVVITHPHVELGISPRPTRTRRAVALWAATATALVAQESAGRTVYDLSFLPESGDRLVADLDADGIPDVVHVSTTNDKGRYGFFRTPPLEKTADGSWPEIGPTHRPANCVIDLAGFQLDPELVDLNGDGRLDLVLTTIEIDGASIVSAVVSGKVRAKTRAFLNRSGSDERWFRSEPDTTVESEAGVKVLFTYAGTVDVRRALTLIVDGDFDGDGHKDLAIRTSADTVSVWPGLPAGGWSGDARTVKIPAIGTHVDIEGYAYDADGDGKDEMLFVYRTAHEPDRRGNGTERLVLLSPGF